MKPIPLKLLIGFAVCCVMSPCLAEGDVYVITSKVNGKVPKIGPVQHVSIAICPVGVSPIVYEIGVAVSNCVECRLYGTQFFERGFKLDEKRIGVSAQRVIGVSAEAVEARMQSHQRLNIPLLSDCRHHAMQVIGHDKTKGPLGRFIAPLR